MNTLRYDAQGFRAAMEEALSLEPETAVAAEIYAQLAYYSLGRAYMWKEPPPRELCEQWLAKALEYSDPDTPARAWALLAQAASDPSERVEAANEVHRLGEALGDPRLVVFAYEAQTLAATEVGRYQEACDWADRALAAGPKLANPNYESHQYWNAGFVYLNQITVSGNSARNGGGAYVTGPAGFTASSGSWIWPRKNPSAWAAKKIPAAVRYGRPMTSGSRSKGIKAKKADCS